MATAARLTRRLGLRLGTLGRGRDFALTIAAEFVQLGCALLVLKLAAARWGTTGFGEYVVARRTLGLLQLPILCGMGVAVTRYVARSRAAGDAAAVPRFFAGGISVAVVTAGLAALTLNLAPRPISTVMFGTPEYEAVVHALSVAVAGMALHGVAYGYFRGEIAMVQANLLHVVNWGMVPLAALAVPGLTVVQVISLTGVLWCAVAGSVIVHVLAHSPRGSLAPSAFGAAARELVTYGAPRVPGEFALGALFALPVTVAAHYTSVEAAGFLGLGVSVLTMVGSIFVPLGHVILPAVSARAVGTDRDQLRADSWRMIRLSLALAVVIAVGLQLAARPLVMTFFGPQFAPAVPVIRIIGLAVVPYIAYIVLRNFLDALHTSPLNAKNLLVALGTFLALSIVIGPDGGVPVALAVSLVALGALSWYDLHRALAAPRSE